MARLIIRDRILDPKRVGVERISEGVYLVGVSGIDFHDMTRAEWAAFDASVLAGFDAADEHHTVLRDMGVA